MGRRLLYFTVFCCLQSSMATFEEKYEEMHCLVTVGTTEFNDLMINIDEQCDRFLDVLKNKKGINCLTIQKGRGKYVPHKIIKRNEATKALKSINVIEYTSSGQEFQDLLKKSALII